MYGSEIFLASPREIASCLGNVSMKINCQFVHAHAVLASQSGEPKAGHLLEGCVFAVEVYLMELLGIKIERKPGSVTDLSPWNI